MLPGDKFRLLLAGDGPLRQLVEQSSAKDHRIRYCGYLSFAGVLKLYEEASVLVCMRMTRKLRTSYLFPSKVMEYLASGVPVISTCTSHLEEEYKDYVYLLHNEDAESLASLLRRLANTDPDERLEKARKAKLFMSNYKSWDAQGRRAAEYILKEVLSA
jgi:glycosyltransferase involved in cell wall biosynthesis